MDGCPNLRLYNVILDVQITQFGPKSLHGRKGERIKIIIIIDGWWLKGKFVVKDAFEALPSFLSCKT